MTEAKYEHWIEEFDGKEVVVQLVGVQYSVRPPGRLILLDAEGRPSDNPSGPINMHRMPVIEGLAEATKDKQGNFRLVMVAPDMLGSALKIRISLDPKEIHSVTETEEPSRIVS